MLDGRYFDAMDAVARAVRKNDRPFGGIQLILSGDFFQLPPVNKGESEDQTVFCFQAKAWARAVPNVVLLKEVHRQVRPPDGTRPAPSDRTIDHSTRALLGWGDQTDRQFLRILAEIRRGECSDATAEFLQSTASNVVGGDGIKPTLLHSHNEAVGTSRRQRRNESRTYRTRRLKQCTVLLSRACPPVLHEEAENQARLQELPGPVYTLEARDSVADENVAKQLDRVCPIKRVLELKANAQVILMKVEGGRSSGRRDRSRSLTGPMSAAAVARRTRTSTFARAWPTAPAGWWCASRKSASPSFGYAEPQELRLLSDTADDFLATACTTAFAAPQFLSGVEEVIGREKWALKSGTDEIAVCARTPCDGRLLRLYQCSVAGGLLMGAMPSPVGTFRWRWRGHCPSTSRRA